MLAFEWPLPMKMPLRRLLSLVAGWGAMASGQAQSQSSANYPTKPVRFVCVTAPGGGLDVIGRIVAVGAQPVGKSPPEFEAMLKADYEATQKLVAQIGLKVD